MSTTREQRMSSLERANEIRWARSELRAAVRRGEIFAASVLLDPPREARSWSITELLLAQRHWGSKRAGRLLRRHRIPELKPIGALTERQRRVLAGALNGSPGEGG